MSIFDDTALILEIIADCVAREAANCGAVPAVAIPDISRQLSERADRIYAANRTFARRLRAPGNAGRDTLYAFMRHWLASRVKTALGNEAFKRLPEGFALGRDPYLN